MIIKSHYHGNTIISSPIVADVVVLAVAAVAALVVCLLLLLTSPYDQQAPLRYFRQTLCPQVRPQPPSLDVKPCCAHSKCSVDCNHRHNDGMGSICHSDHRLEHIIVIVF